jgi:hypothetical protein
LWFVVLWSKGEQRGEHGFLGGGEEEKEVKQISHNNISRDISSSV